MARRLTFALLALTSLLALPGTAAADEKPTVGVWLAADTAQAMSQQASWGRLTVRHDTLTFSRGRSEFVTPLADITRVSAVKGTNVFEIETASGTVLRLMILSPQMEHESPKKAMQFIQRAVRVAPPAQRPVQTLATAPAGGQIR